MKISLCWKSYKDTGTVQKKRVCEKAVIIILLIRYNSTIREILFGQGNFIRSDYDAAETKRTDLF